MNTNTPQPAQETIDKEELMQQLYQRYAQGGTFFSRLRLNFTYWRKRSLWSLVIRTTYFIKRSMDILISSIALILLSPLLLLTMLAIKLDSSGPIFFAQNRIGKWGKIFKMYKLRSMYTNAEAMKEKLLQENETGGVTFKMKADPRITRIGKFIRKFSIDELPQLWNVLKGDMAIVGPRPPVSKEVYEYDPEQRKRLDIKPGITCIWQVSGRSDINFDGQVHLDIEYIYSQSILTDLKILLKTIPAVLTGRGAY